MSDHLTTADVVRLASRTHVRASRMSADSSLFGWWHERKFVQAIDHFTEVLRSLPQQEIQKASREEIHRVGQQVDEIINDVERFIDGHGGSNLKRVERDRYLVKRIYELRASYEKVARRVTAQPGMTDLRWKVKLETAHRKPQ